MIGLRVTAYGPEEVSRLGEPTTAGERLGALHAAIIAARMPAASVAALAERSTAPVIDGGGPGGDPAGALADLAVLDRAIGSFEGRKLAWVGDATGLFHDLLVGGSSLGLSVAIAHPIGFAPDPDRVTWARERAAVSRAAVLVTTELSEALLDASAVYVEPWPAGAEERFRGYALQRHTLRNTRGGVVFLHASPERRAGECSASLTDDPGWLAVEQSRARADAWAAVLGWCLEPDPIRSVLRRER